MSKLAERAIQHIRCLAEEIGARPAGSHSESQALEYAADLLASWGYALERTPAPFAQRPRWVLPSLLGAAWLAASGWLAETLPAATAWTALLLSALPQISRAYLMRRKPDAHSQNLYAFLPGSAAAPLLILCAHIDSACAGPFTGMIWRRINYHAPLLVQRSAIFISALAILQWLGLQAPQVFFWLAGIAGSLTGAWLLVSQFLSARTSPHVPGALDNASGAALLLALAEHYGKQPPAALRLGFLFTGAEETGMHGAQAFALKLRSEHSQAQLLNLDMVGAGNRLEYVTKDGIFFPLKTDPNLNQRIVAANPQAQPLHTTLRSGDHAAFLRLGIAASALQTAGSPAAEMAYHSLNDTLAIIQPEALAMTAETVMRLIDSYSEQ